jgi:hypothetical protein|tara:strand:- start:20 stop:256 length:237 start_codon:yes stop_codon:yes gene_type:complete
LWQRVQRKDVLRTQKLTEGTGPKSLLLWRNPMAKVTYRGVEYDTDEYNAKVLAEAAQRKNHDLMYRGLKVKSKAIPCS